MRSSPARRLVRRLGDDGRRCECNDGYRCVLCRQVKGGWRLKAAPGGCATKPAYAGWDETRHGGRGYSQRPTWSATSRWSGVPRHGGWGYTPGTAARGAPPSLACIYDCFAEAWHQRHTPDPTLPMPAGSWRYRDAADETPAVQGMPTPGRTGWKPGV